MYTEKVACAMSKVLHIRKVAPSFVENAPYNRYLRQLSEPKQGISNHYHFVIIETSKVSGCTVNKNISSH